MNGLFAYHGDVDRYNPDMAALTDVNKCFLKNKSLILDSFLPPLEYAFDYPDAADQMRR